MSWQAWFYAVKAVHIRNLKLLRRQKQLIMAPFLLPIVIMILTAVIMGAGGDQWPVALVDEAKSPQSKALVDSIRQSHSNITPYFSLVETSLQQAKEDVHNGRMHMMIRIPKDFDRSHVVYTETFNINTDMMKNVRLRLEHALLDHAATNQMLTVKPKLVTKKPDDVWRVSYIAGSSFLLALMFAAAIVAANLFAFDRENRTRKEILLTSGSAVTTAGAGILLSSVMVAIAASLVTLLVGVLIFRLRVQPMQLAYVYLGMIPVSAVCSTLGILIAHWLKRFRVIQPVIIVSFMATFFGAGGFAGVTVLPPVARGFANIWPFSYVFEWFNPVLHNFKPGLNLGQILILTAIAIASMLLLPWVYRREMLEQISGGQ